MAPSKKHRFVDDHFSPMEDAFYRDMEKALKDEKEIDRLLDQLFPTS